MDENSRLLRDLEALSNDQDFLDWVADDGIYSWEKISNAIMVQIEELQYAAFMIGKHSDSEIDYKKFINRQKALWHGIKKLLNRLK